MEHIQWQSFSPNPFVFPDIGTSGTVTGKASDMLKTEPVTIAVIRKVTVAAILLYESREHPTTPCPDVHPFARPVPNPAKTGNT